MIKTTYGERPPLMTRKAFRYQEPAIAYTQNRNKIALFMEMRLGKTYVAIQWIQSLARCRRVLIIAPLTVCTTWQEELEMDGIESTILSGTEKQIAAQLHEDPKYCIVNYDKISVRACIRVHDWDCVILDESTMIRNQTQRTRAVQRGFESVKYKAILTGMANPQSELDYFEQMSFLHGSFMGHDNYYRFRHALFTTDGRWAWNPKKGTAQSIDEIIRRDAFVLTRKQAGINTEKIRQSRHVVLPQELRKAYEIAEEEYILGDEETKWAIHVQIWLRQLCGGGLPDFESKHKVNEIRSLMGGELAKEPLVIWFAFRREMKLVEDSLRAKGYRTTHIHGGVGTQLRKIRRQSFQRGELDAICCQMDCARFGLDLSRSSTAIYYSRSWNPESNWQSEDRIIHPSKKEPALILDLTSVDTLEEVLLETLLEKRRRSRSFTARMRVKLTRKMNGE